MARGDRKEQSQTLSALLRLHVRAQNRIHPRLISAPASFEEFKNIAVNADGDSHLGQLIYDLGIFPVEIVRVIWIAKTCGRLELLPVSAAWQCFRLRQGNSRDIF